MKKLLQKTKTITALLTLATLLALPGLGWGQYSVNFDGASDGTSASAYGFTNHNLNGITWTGVEVIIPTTPLAADWYNGVRSARLRGYSTSHMTMTSNKANGIGTISFNYRRYGTDSQVAWKVEYSTDNGETWTQAGSNFTAPANDNIQVFSETVNVSGNARIRIIHVSGGNTSTNRRLNIDDLLITDYSGSVSAPTTQASDITFGSVGQNGMTAGWTNGDGAKRVVLITTSNSFTDPTDGTDPTANTVYGGSGEQVVYNNSGNSVAVTGLSASTTYWFRVYEYNGSGATTKYLTSAATDNPNSQATTAPAPLIASPDPASLSGFSTIAGTASTAQTFTISGTNLTADLVVTAPTDYEVRENETGSYGSSVSFTPSSGTVSEKTIQVRIAASAGVGTPSGNVVCSSTGATSQNVAVSGTVNEPPSITFYFRGPSWMNNNPHNPEIWGPYNGWSTPPAMTFDVVPGWWSVTVVVADASASIEYQSRFSQDGTTKYQKAFENFSANPTFTTTTGKIWIDASQNSSFYWQGNDFYLLQDKITETQPFDEPASHATVFSAIANTYSSITVTWTDSDATGYLIKGSDVSYEAITAPVDGVAEANAALVRNFASGVGTWQFTGLNGSTTYYFKIYPYNGTGTGVNYKTDGSVPTDDATTLDPPIVIWAPSSLTGYGPSPWSATLSNEHLTVVGLTRGSGVGTSGTAAANAWGGTMNTANVATSATAITNNQFVTFTLTSNALYRLSLTTFDLWYRRSSTGPASGLLQYAIGEGGYNDIATISFSSTASSGASIAQIDLSGIAALQDLNMLEVAKFRIALYGNGAANGTWYVFNTGLEIGGFVNDDNSTFTESGNWTNASKWSNGIPDATTDVTIDGNVTVDDVVACNNLTISSGGAVTVGSGQGLIVNGNFLIESDASGTGSFIGADNDYVIVGSSAVQQYIAGAEQWHFLSSPVANQAIAGVWTPAGTYGDETGYDFYAWEESNIALPWLNQKVGGNGITNFVPGKGYLVAYEVPATKEFTGTLNTGDITFNLKNSGSKSWTYNSGWNLIGNPYPSAIDWNLVTRTPFQDEFAYIYNGTAYTPIDGSSANAYIAANQGFFVLADVASNNQDFTFTNATRAHGGSYLKTTGIDDKFVIQLANENFSDNTTIRFREQGSARRDRLDALKLFSFSTEVPQVYTRTSDGINVAVNSIPGNGEVLSIPLSVRIPANGNMTLSLQHVEGAFANQTIYLHDQLTGVNHNLSTNPVYAFTAPQGDNETRFSLHFSTVGIDNPTTGEAVQVYAHSGLLYINGAPANAQVTLTDITGRVVQRITTGGGSLTTVNVSNLPRGIYVVNVVSGQQTLSRKIIL